MKPMKWIATLSFILALILPELVSAQIATAPIVAPIPIPQPGPKHQPDMVTEGNLWTVTGYQDAFRHAPYRAKQNLCYFYLGRRGTHDVYAWIATSHRLWWGFAEKEGDQVSSFGNFVPVIQDIPLTRWWEVNWRGHTAMQYELVLRGKGRVVSRDVAMGHVNAAIEPGLVRAFANVKLVRTGKCLSRLAAQIKDTIAGSHVDGLQGDVQISDALIDLLVNASADIPEEKRGDGTTADSPFETELVSAE